MKKFLFLAISCLIISCSNPTPLPTNTPAPTYTFSPTYTPYPTFTPEPSENILITTALDNSEINRIFGMEAFEEVEIAYENTGENPKSYLGTVFYKNSMIAYGADLYSFLNIYENASCEGLSRELMDERLVESLQIFDIDIRDKVKITHLPPDIWAGYTSDGVQIMCGFSYSNVCVTYNLETVGVDPETVTDLMLVIALTQFDKLLRLGY